MNYLFVVAHPDDEVLGAGGTMYNLSKRGHNVYVCILSGKADARSRRPETEELLADTKLSMKLLGVKEYYLGDFPNMKLNTLTHLELVQFIEKTIETCKADVVVTHHAADLNNDHLHTSITCQAAVRIFQRRTDEKPIRDFLFMEVPSSTDWSLNTAMKKFEPNTFFEIGEEGLNKKIEALSAYRGVMREYPHPRSDEALRAIVTWRGAQVGLKYAEAFETVMRRVVIQDEN